MCILFEFYQHTHTISSLAGNGTSHCAVFLFVNCPFRTAAITAMWTLSEANLVHRLFNVLADQGFLDQVYMNLVNPCVTAFVACCSRLL